MEEPQAQEKQQNSLLSEKLRWVRYWIIRFVSVPVPFLRSSVPIVGGKTFIELIVLGIAFAIGIMTALPDYANAGNIADYLGVVTVVVGFRNNILSGLLGISYERALFWHKAVGILALVVTIIHSFEGMTNPSGLGIVIVMLVMTGLYFVKKWIFNIFYFVHLAGILCLIALLYAHYATYFPAACCLWVLDAALRYVITLRKVNARVEILPGDVIRIQFDKSFNYESGQYCFLMIKEISLFEFHPFSLSSCPEDAQTSFHIRELGDWTKKLGEYIRESGTKGELTLDIYVEGPYGSSSINLEDTNYQVVMLISGGIGITPMHSIYNHLVYQQSNGRALRKVIFIWSVRDKATIFSMQSSKLHNFQKSSYLPISFQPPMSDAPQPRKAKVEHILVKPFQMGSANGQDAEAQIDSHPDQQDLMSDYVFFNEYYLTSAREPKEEFGIHPEVQKWLKLSRPNLPDLFQQTTKLCLSENISRVAVCVCGPQSMVNEVADFCRRSQMAPTCCQNVRFDCHSEVFDF